jgi:NADH-quinone oxidoreductase subunit M
MTGPIAKDNDRIHDLVPREIFVVAPLIALLLVLGVYPKPVLDIINPAVDNTMTAIGQHDPAPTVLTVSPQAEHRPRTAEGPRR